jgi:hypothetical protein
MTDIMVVVGAIVAMFKPKIGFPIMAIAFIIAFIRGNYV